MALLAISYRRLINRIGISTQANKVSWIMALWDDIAEYFTFIKGRPPKMTILKQSKVTPEITEWSKKLVFSPNEYPMGSMTQKDFGDLQIVGRIEHHTWSHDKTGKLITGNFRGITLYELT